VPYNSDVTQHKQHFMDAKKMDLNTRLLSCKCGSLRGEVRRIELGKRAVCYCKDCQVFAKFLGKSEEILDGQGGTEVVGIRPQHLVFTKGSENIACVSLTDRGLYRWYARCCNTAIGNTPRNHKIAHVGLIHSVFQGGVKGFEESFGPGFVKVNTKGAKGYVEPSKGLFNLIVGHVISLVRERASGGFKVTPFFDTTSERPIVAPYVLKASELESLRSTV
jgi:Family of unknown function (DUF6151)